MVVEVEVAVEGEDEEVVDEVEVVVNLIFNIETAVLTLP
jgi:hypothetical protein